MMILLNNSLHSTKNIKYKKRKYLMMMKKIYKNYKQNYKHIKNH